MAKIYTKTGDSGETGLIGGSRVLKSSARVGLIGEVDELNAVLGVARSFGLPTDVDGLLNEIQCSLFSLGAELADPFGKLPRSWSPATEIEAFEGWIDRCTAETPPLREFILPGGSGAAAALHLARTVCRRAERSAVNFAQSEQLAPDCVIYLNRLSDLLFALARTVNHRSNVQETKWHSKDNL